MMKDGVEMRGGEGPLPDSRNNRHVDLSLYPTGTRPKGDGIVLSPFLGDGVNGFTKQCLI